MSIVLTNRDTATMTLSAALVDANGVRYGVSTSTPQDAVFGLARFTNPAGMKGVIRGNFHLERRKTDSLGKVWPLKVDITIAVDGGHPYTADDVDDLVTSATNYFAAEADASLLLQGVART